MSTLEGLLQDLQQAHKSFDPNQPRDESGRWSGEGGSSSTGSKPKRLAKKIFRATVVASALAAGVAAYALSGGASSKPSNKPPKLERPTLDGDFHVVRENYRNVRTGKFTRQKALFDEDQARKLVIKHLSPEDPSSVTDDANLFSFGELDEVISLVLDLEDEFDYVPTKEELSSIETVGDLIRLFEGETDA